MAFNGSGTFLRLYNWITDRANGIKIRADRMDEEMDGMAAGLSKCITRDGQSTISNDIPFNNRKITNLGAATAGSHALNRDTADARFVRNTNDLTPETDLANEDEFPFWDASASSNRASTYANLREKLGFPTGTKTLFVQTNAPVGWTKDTTHNNKALRIVSGTASTGGSTPFTTVFAARTITQANLPNVTLSGNTDTRSHRHHGFIGDSSTSSSAGMNANQSPFRQNTNGGSTQNYEINGAGTEPNVGRTSAENLNFAVTVALGGSGTAMDFAVQYVDTIIATKD